MSLQAMVWAMDQIPLLEGDLTCFAVLCRLANYAGEDGRNAFPSAATLAAKLCISPRSVRAKVGWLAAHGFISLGDQALVAHMRADRRPRVWDLNMSGRTLTTAEFDGIGGLSDGVKILHPVEGGREEGSQDASEGVPPPVSGGVRPRSPRPPSRGEDPGPRGEAQRIHGVKHASPKPKDKPKDNKPPIAPQRGAEGENCDRVPADPRVDGFAAGFAKLLDARGIPVKVLSRRERAGVEALLDRGFDSARLLDVASWASHDARFWGSRLTSLRVFLRNFEALRLQAADAGVWVGSWHSDVGNVAATSSSCGPPVTSIVAAGKKIYTTESAPDFSLDAIRRHLTGSSGGLAVVVSQCGVCQASRSNRATHGSAPAFEDDVGAARVESTAEAPIRRRLDSETYRCPEAEWFDSRLVERYCGL